VVAAARRWATGVLLRGSYVYQHTHDRADGAELSNSPQSLALVHAAVPAWSRRVTFAAESQYVGDRLSNVGTVVPGEWLANVNVTVVPPGRRLSLSARVSNLFDTAYTQPVGLEFRQDAMPQDGRTASVRATLRF
jgi:outer membrane receptor protein involved in Fe transport